MLTLNTIKADHKARKKSVRVGRGQGSGVGCTAGRGYNGDGARSGSHTKGYFEGGQTPLTRRTPKRGFTGPHKMDYEIVNLGDLENIETTEKEITPEIMFQNGLIRTIDKPIKILGTGIFTRSFSIKADAYSASVRDKLKIPKAKISSKKMRFKK